MFLNPELKDRIFLEARDIFFRSMALTPLTSASGLGSAIAEQLSLSIEQAEWVLGAHTPELHTERSQSDGRIIGVQIGRTSLEARSPQRSHPVPNITVNSFALHRPSLLLLEQLATAVRFNEPLLPVGETGTGKTTAIQYLASLLSHPLTVFNLSNQTEVSDLVGGFKPIDARVPASNLLLKFIFFCSMRRSTLDETSNSIRPFARRSKIPDGSVPSLCGGMRCPKLSRGSEKGKF